MPQHVRSFPLPALALCCLLAAAAGAGCKTSTRSGLPGHIRAVEVEMFKNNTMYRGLEGRLTRALIDGINYDPAVRAVSGGGDAVITGEITDVRRYTVRETTTNEPATASLVVYARFSFYDKTEGRYLIEERVVSSSDSSQAAGLYETQRGESVSLAEEGAVAVLARDIVRQTIGMW